MFTGGGVWEGDESNGRGREMKLRSEMESGGGREVGFEGDLIWEKKRERKWRRKRGKGK